MPPDALEWTRQRPGTHPLAAERYRIIDKSRKDIQDFLVYATLPLDKGKALFPAVGGRKL